MNLSPGKHSSASFTGEQHGGLSDNSLVSSDSIVDAKVNDTGYYANGSREKDDPNNVVAGNGAILHEHVHDIKDA